ncbi:MAG: VOC family protein [Chloroflexota bacterium]
MTIRNALASVAVQDIDRGAEWYARLLGEEGSRPMPDLAEWTFERGGGLQVYRGPDRAGRGSLTLAVTDLEHEIERLEAMGVDTSGRVDGPGVRTVMVRDPDGNSIALAEATDPRLAR